MSLGKSDSFEYGIRKAIREKKVLLAKVGEDGFGVTILSEEELCDVRWIGLDVFIY